MIKVSDITTVLSSGLNPIDALLSNGPGWNFLMPARTYIAYSFSIAAGNESGRFGQQNFSAAQQTATRSALGYIAGLTGIEFRETGDGSAADLHFCMLNLSGSSTSGLCSWGYHYTSEANTNVVTQYTADAYVYLDNAEWLSQNSDLTEGGSGYQTLLHEIGHALGLKHPFDNSPVLPAEQDNTANTLMSYNDIGGPYATFNPYDIAALNWIYGGDGLGGALGINSSNGGRFWTGSAVADHIVAGSGNDYLQGESGDDVLEGGAGDDTINGGDGKDTAVFAGAFSLYHYAFDAQTDTITVSSVTTGTDQIVGVELFQFADITKTAGQLHDSAINHAPTGTVNITGIATQGQTLTIANSLADQDGLGVVAYQWLRGDQPISGATGSRYTLTQADVGATIVVLASFTDGLGHPESVSSLTTAQIANINDAPTGSVDIAGIPEQGRTLTVSNTLVDMDGLGVIHYQWKANGEDISTATASRFVLDLAQVGKVISVEARYIDGFGTLEIVESRATVPIVASNHPPLLQRAIGDQYAMEDTPFSFIVAEDTFLDSDAADTLVYKLSQSDGSDLPAWLSFNPQTRVLSGTPSQANVGSVELSITAFDGVETSAADHFLVTVANVNDVPTGTLSISGIAAPGQTLSVLQSLTDEDGLGEFHYHWLRSGQLIDEANGEHYPVTAKDLGHMLAVQLSYLDNWGTQETITSQPTSWVLPRVTVSGVPSHGKLSGTAGNDTFDATTVSGIILVGGKGDDNYCINRSGTKIQELAYQGNDTVFASASFTLGNQLENLVLLGSAALDGKGNALNNQLIGNDGNNRLSGMAGNDSLTGGLGRDQFVFESPLSSKNVDYLTDFTAGEDQIVLKAQLFKKLGPSVDAEELWYKTSPEPQGKNAFMVYDPVSGELFYDADGNGVKAAIKIAIIGSEFHPALQVKDFSIL